MPRKLLLYRLRSLFTISLVWIVFGIVFFQNLIRPGNDLGIKVSLIQFALTFGIIGFLISAILIFFLKPAFNHQPVWIASLAKLFINLFIFVFIAFDHNVLLSIWNEFEHRPVCRKLPDVSVYKKTMRAKFLGVSGDIFA